MIKRESATSVRLCCGKAGCPVVSKADEDGYITITDDFGNTVKVKTEEAELISDGVKIVNGQKVICG